jgi:2-dehydropantoate 2-reductase
VGPEGLVLTLQNGLGNADIIARYVGAERVLAGTTAQGATLLGPGQIRHAGSGQTLLGMWGGGDPAHAQAVAEYISDCGITTETVDTIERVIWKKLIVNVGINAVTALTGIRNGQLLDLETTRKMCEAAVHEAAVVAKALGVDIGANPAKQVFQVARTTAPNRSSMGQDVDNKRRTEIEAINGAVVREAEKLRIQVPVNRTLTALIKTLEAHY